MEYTGERVIPKLMNPKDGMLREHILRYTFARNFSRGKVLDIACGVGYGSEELLKGENKIKEIVGVDICKESIEYAKENYMYTNTSYYRENVLDLGLPKKLGKFDTIISFETIEHFMEDRIFINNLYNMLEDDGTLIISTPFGRGKKSPCSNPFHAYQYTEKEFLEVLSPFSKVEMYHQLNEIIELPKENKKYYLMVAVCKK